jgi:hypothetical protein
MTIKKMYQVATTAQMVGKGKSPAAINKIRYEEIPAEVEDDENKVAAFNRRGARPKTKQNNFQAS